MLATSAHWCPSWQNAARGFEALLAGGADHGQVRHVAGRELPAELAGTSGMYRRTRHQTDRGDHVYRVATN